MLEFERDDQYAATIKVIGVGGGGGKLAKAFLDLGFNKTLLINTTPKDKPEGVDEKHMVIIPEADGVGKDVELGKIVAIIVEEKADLEAFLNYTAASADAPAAAVEAPAASTPAAAAPQPRCICPERQPARSSASA